MKNAVITSNEPVKVMQAENELSNMERANMIGTWHKTKKITKVVWEFSTEDDAKEMSSFFMNRVRFEEVLRP